MVAVEACRAELKRGRPCGTIEIGEHGRRQPTKRCVCVLVDPPVFDDLPGLSENSEYVFFQTFISQSAIDAFDECVLLGLTGRDVAPANAGVLAPPQNGMRCHFRPIIADNHIRLAAPAPLQIGVTLRVSKPKLVSVLSAQSITKCAINTPHQILECNGLLWINSIGLGIICTVSAALNQICKLGNDVLLASNNPLQASYIDPNYGNIRTGHVSHCGRL